MVLNTTFLVREIRRNEQHDAFINAVTHELKTPVASIRLYLETLQTRPVDEAKRQEFYRTMVEDSDRLLATIEQVLRTGRIGSTSHRKLHLTRIDLNGVIEECLARTRDAASAFPRSARIPARSGRTIMGDLDEVRAAVSNLIDNAVKYSGSAVQVLVETASCGRQVHVGARARSRPRHPEDGTEADFQAFLPRSRPAGHARQRNWPGALHRPLRRQTARRPRVGGERRARAAAARSFCSFRS